MTSRAAILPTPGDPFILAGWLNHYKNVWKDEVDRLYVHLNSRLEDPVINYSKKLVEDVGGTILYSKGWLGHGEALRVLVETVEEEFIVLCEDDAYVLSSGIVDQLFGMVERKDTDAIASGRVSCAISLQQREIEVFKLRGGDIHLPNFWPCFFFCPTQMLLDTDRNYAAKNWEKGEYIKELDWTTPDNISADTFGWTSIQLRNKGYRFHLIPDGRSTTQDRELFVRRQGIFAAPPIAPWIHFGSTSSGISNSLLDNELKPLENRYAGGAPTQLPVMPDDHIRDDYARRISLWLLCTEYFPIKDKESMYFNQVYLDAINRTVDGCSLDRGRLQEYVDIYEQVLKVVWEK